MKRFAVLFAPHFRLQATLRHEPEKMSLPAALVEGSKLLVMESNEAAWAAHVVPGLSPAQALARCPELQVLRPNEGHERSAQEILLQAGENLSPFLESTLPGVVAVELPPEREWTETELCERIVQPLQALRLRVQLGVAVTVDLGLLAARLARPVRIVTDPSAFVGPLAVEELEPSDELRDVLQLWGVRTIGQLLALPRNGLGERLGTEALTLCERVTNHRPRPLRLVKPQAVFAEQADIEYPIETLEPLLFLLRRFLDQLSRRLEQVYLAAGRLELCLLFENGNVYRKVFVLPQPTREVDLLFRMLYTHLESVKADAPIVGLKLTAVPTRPLAEQSDLLEKSLRDPHQFAETCARLQALVGAERVGTPVLKASHHPDAFIVRPYSFSPLPVSAKADPEANNDVSATLPWLRFRPALPARVLLSDAQCPAFLYSARVTGPIHEARGPWRLEGNWWNTERWAREDWDITTDDGIYRLVRTGTQWTLDGVYA